MKHDKRVLEPAFQTSIPADLLDVCIKKCDPDYWCSSCMVSLGIKMCVRDEECVHGYGY